MLQGQRTYNKHVRVRVTIAAVENQQLLHILSVCVCVYSSSNYPVRKAHAPYYIVICDCLAL
jgi:hypothetical protein